MSTLRLDLLPHQRLLFEAGDGDFVVEIPEESGFDDQLADDGEDPREAERRAEEEDQDSDQRHVRVQSRKVKVPRVEERSLRVVVVREDGQRY